METAVNQLTPRQRYRGSRKYLNVNQTAMLEVFKKDPERRYGMTEAGQAVGKTYKKACHHAYPIIMKLVSLGYIVKEKEMGKAPKYYLSACAVKPLSL